VSCGPSASTRAAGGVAGRVVGVGQRAAQFRVARRLGLHALQQGASLLGLARLLQLGGVQQGHPRLFREALDQLVDDALGQLGLIQAQRQAPEFLPGLELVGNGIGVEQLVQHLGRHVRIAVAAHQRHQRVAPAARILVAQQRHQQAARLAQVAVAQRQRGLGAAHRQRFGRALAPQRQGLGRGLGIVGQHRDPGRALGQAGIAGDLGGGLQVPVRGIGQLPGLQGEFAGQHRRQRGRRGARRQLGGGGRRGRRGAGDRRRGDRRQQ